MDNGTDAIGLMNELVNINGDITHAKLKEIHFRADPDGLLLRIKCLLDMHGREVVENFLKERNLKMKEEEGHIAIYQ